MSEFGLVRRHTPPFTKWATLVNAALSVICPFVPITEKYGFQFGEGATPATIELEMFYRGITPEQGGLGRYGHMHNAIDHLFNEPRRLQAASRNLAYEPRRDDLLIWNDWSELMIRTFCEFEWVSVTGPNSSWKSYCAAMYALMRFFSSPLNTIVVMTSTSLPGLRRRIWKEVTRFHRICPAFGHVVASEYCIRFSKGSDASGIFGVATGTDNDIEKAVDKILGFHAANVVAVVDEGQATNEALVKASISLEAGAEHFQFIILGNADSELDPHGQASEPVEGWDSISVEDDFWLTRRGACVHLDCYDCPRVREGDEFYPGLLKQSNIDSAIKSEGEDSPYFWQFRRGFWAPQGITKTVLSPVDAKRFRTSDPVIWVGKFVVLATLDPAYEGDDKCVLRQHFCGLADIDGEEIVVLCHGEIVILKLKVSKSEDPIHFQIAQQTVENCERWGVTPDMFAIDSTAEGEGPAGILVKNYGWHGLERVDFNGRASDEPISPNSRTPANKKWDRKVTELWFRYRERVRNGQVRGLDKTTLLEFCQRNYEDRGNGIISIETKRDMKERTHRSPDHADNAVLAEHLVRKRGIMKDPPTIDGEELPDPMERWNRLARKYNVRNEEIYDDAPTY